ncbi:SDR family oxidoreductase [Marivita sp.]|uniref:SDR family oxidoreductase n=1 Tax=Marivita sp. TaxID=2003365 RepID=UPI003F6D3509
MKRVFIAGATGYLGRFICAEYQRRGWYVIALVRKTSRAQRISADQLIEAQATQPATLEGLMAGADLVISCLGITRQADGLGYWDVDYQANVNLLHEAERAGVGRFAYIHVLRAAEMAHVPLVAAKSAFVNELQNSSLATTVIAPTGYFSDMGDFLKMAKAGRVWLFGDGSKRINPIHGADLALATADAIEAGSKWCDIGGPDIVTQKELAELAFTCLGKPSRIVFLPDVFRRLALRLLPLVTPRRISGPARFFLSAIAHDMVGAQHGTHHLKDHFESSLGVTKQYVRSTPMRKGKDHEPRACWRNRRPDLRSHIHFRLCPASHSAGPIGLRNEQHRRGSGSSIQPNQSSGDDHMEHRHLHRERARTCSVGCRTSGTVEKGLGGMEHYHSDLWHNLDNTGLGCRNDRQCGH